TKPLKEATVAALIEVNKALKPLNEDAAKSSTSVFLNCLLEVSQRRPFLAEKIKLCGLNNLALQNMHNNITNKGEVTKERIKNAATIGIYRFEHNEKSNTCELTMKYDITQSQQENSSRIERSYNMADLHDLYGRALLIGKSRTSDQLPDDDSIRDIRLHVNQFVTQVDLAQQIVAIASRLIQSGHFLYQKKCIEKHGSELQQTLTKLSRDLEIWKDVVDRAQNEYYYLTFFSARHILTFYEYFKSINNVANNESNEFQASNREICQNLVRFINDAAHLPEQTDEWPTIQNRNDFLPVLRKIGTTLRNIFNGINRQIKPIPDDLKQLITPLVTYTVFKGKIFVADCHSYSLVPNVILSLFVNHQSFPEAWQILICRSTTTEEEISLFIKRSFIAAKNGYKDYLFCIANVELLDFELQYHLVQTIHNFQEKGKDYLLALICTREKSINHHILEQFTENVHPTNGLDDESMKLLYTEICRNSICVTSNMSGQGKTEWIKESSFKQKKVPRTLLISDKINFETLVQKLANCKLDTFESLHIDINLITHPHDVNFFLFQLLAFGTVFNEMNVVHLPDTLFFIEIASTIGQYLLESLSLTKYMCRQHIEWDLKNLVVPHHINSPIQIASYYMDAHSRDALNTINIRLTGTEAIKEPLSAERCQELLRQYFFSGQSDNIFSYRFLEIFVNVLADQLVRLSASSFFQVEQLRLMTKETKIRSSLFEILISCSKEFATRAINTKDMQKIQEDNAQKGNNQDVDNARLGNIAQWNDSNHLIVAFLSQMPNSICALYRDKTKVPKNVVNLLKSQKAELQDYHKMETIMLLEILKRLARRNMHKLEGLPEYALSIENLLKMAMILLRARANIPVVCCGEAGCGKTIKEAEELANEDETWLFLDEINTCDHIGILGSLISHRIFNGKPIHPNIRIFAACNPYRLRTKAQSDVGLSAKLYEEKSNLVYQVHPLPDQILYYVWDYGYLKAEDEKNYIDVMVKTKLDHPFFAELLYSSQTFIRNVEEPFSVSLRDVKRAIKLFKFFKKYNPSNLSAGRVSEPHEIRPMVLALSLCYLFRLHDQSQRKKYREEIISIIEKHHKTNHENSQQQRQRKKQIGDLFQITISKEQNMYIKKMQLPEGTALNEALQENILVMIVCADSSDPYFQTLPQVFIIPYQGSTSSTSEGIEKIFETAKNYQSISTKENPVKAVVFLDEAETSPHNPLKVLHALLEPPLGSKSSQPVVPVIGISNWRLDNSKSSRALIIQRPLFSENDLVNTAKSLLGDSIVLPKINIDDFLNILAKAYFNYIENQKYQNFHGNVLNITRNFGGADNMEELCTTYFKTVLKLKHMQKYEYIPIPVQDLIVINFEEKDIEPFVIIGSQFPDDIDGEDYSYAILNLKRFYESDQDLYILQCDSLIANTGCIRLAKFVIEQHRNKFLEKACQQNINRSIKRIILHFNRQSCEENANIFNFMCGWTQITIESLTAPEKSLLNSNINEILNEKLSFEQILRQELLWCLLCMKHPSSIKSVEHIRLLVLKIPECMKLVNCLKERTIEWLQVNSSDEWQLNIALDKKFLPLYPSFYVALEMYIRLLIRKPIAKLLYVLDKYYAITPLFLWKDEDDLFKFWKQIFINKEIVNIDEELTDPQPNLYSIPGNYLNLQFPFSYYFMEQIDQYKRLYYEQLDNLYEQPENLDTGDNLHPEVLNRFVKEFSMKIQTTITTLTPEILQLARHLYFEDFVTTHCAIAGYLDESDAKLLQFIFRRLCDDEILNDPVRLHIFWWDNSDSLIAELELALMCPSITEPESNLFEGSRFGDYVIDNIVNMMLEKIMELKDETIDELIIANYLREWQRQVINVLSLCANIENSSESKFLQFLRICNDLVSNQSISISDIINTISIQQELDPINILSQEFVDSVLKLFDMPATEQNNTSQCSFFRRCFDIIPIDSPVRIRLYETLFGQEPRTFIGSVLSRVLLLKEDLQERIFIDLIKNAKAVLGRSPRLKAVNTALKNSGIDSKIMALCCDLIQNDFFAEWTFEELKNNFKEAFNVLGSANFEPLQLVLAVALLKEFVNAFWNSIETMPITYDDNIKEVIDEIDHAMQRQSFSIHSFKLYFLRALYDNGLSLHGIRCSCQIQSGTFQWLADFNWNESNNKTDFVAYRCYDQYIEAEDAFAPSYLRCQHMPFENFLNQALNNLSTSIKMSIMGTLITHLYDIRAIRRLNTNEENAIQWLYSQLPNMQFDEVYRVKLLSFLENTNPLYSISPETNPLNYCQQHIENDWQILMCLFDCDDETLALILHSILHSMSESQIETVSRLDTVEKRQAWENEFTQLYINPKVTNALHTATDFQKLVKDAQHTLENEINEILDVDDNYQERFYPRIWRRNGKPSLENLQAYCMGYQNFSVKFPFLSLFFEYHEQLTLMKNLVPIVKFTRMLSSKLHYRLKRDEARSLTFDMFFMKNEVQFRRNIEKAFENFADAWNFIRENVQNESYEFTNSMPRMTRNLPIVYALVEKRDESLYLCKVIEFLVNLQNKFLLQVLAIGHGSSSLKFLGGQFTSNSDNMSQNQNYIESIPLSEAHAKNIINYKWNPKLLSYNQCGLDFSHGREIQYELHKIEAELAYKLLYNKVYLKKHNDSLWLDEFQYHVRLFSSSQTILREIRTLIPQEQIPTEKLGFFTATTSTSTTSTTMRNSYHNINTADMSPIFDNPTNLLSELEILLCFLKRTSDRDPEMEITKYRDKWMMRSLTLTENLQFHKMVSGLKLKHVVALYELVEEKIADVEIECLTSQYMVVLSQQMKNEIDAFVEFEQSHGVDCSDIKLTKIPYRVFELALKRFMFRYLSSEMYDPGEKLAKHLAKNTSD
ncbi:2484_t:CDS:2, partial [Racocetra fulgida]